MSGPTKREDDAPAPPYDLPPVPRTPDGEVRRLGLELEFAGLSVEETTELVASAVGIGPEAVISTTPTEADVQSVWGPFHVEVDSVPLHDQAYLKPLEDLGIEVSEEMSRLIEGKVLSVAREVVPVEIVAPPIPWDELATLDSLWRALREAGAQGTRTSPLHAFGLHLNPEVEDVDVETTRDVLQSYLLLEDWLTDTMEVDRSRQVVPFIRGFPEIYRRLVLMPDYAPDWDGFVRDYVQHNPTRNRPLDLWPLIAHLRGADLAPQVRDWHLVKPRPTYHYRLPNCEITRPGWTPAMACSGWVIIERLAHDDALRAELAEEYLKTIDWPLRMQAGGWREQVRKRLSPLLRNSRLS